MMVPRSALACAVLLATGVATAQAQETLLPLPALRTDYVTPAAAVRPAKAPAPSPLLRNAWVSHERQEQVAPAPQHGDYEQALNSTNWDQGCGDCLVGLNCGPRWFGGVYGLYMNRDNANVVRFTTDQSNRLLTYTTNRSADFDDFGGVEVRVGRTLGNGPFALEGVYWNMISSSETARFLASDTIGGLSTVQDFGTLAVTDPTDFVNDWYDDGFVHEMRRTFEVHNLELNLLRLPASLVCSSCNFRVGGALGVRFMRVDEHFRFSTDDANTTFGDDLDDELDWDIDTENNLIGAQLGCYMEYFLARRFSVFADTKVGVFGNHIRHNSRIGDRIGTVAQVVGGPNDGRLYDVNSTENDVALLGEILLGMRYSINRNWSASIAYRAVGLTGVALPTNQIPQDFTDIDSVADINSNGSLILHGLRGGVEMRF